MTGVGGFVRADRCPTLVSHCPVDADGVPVEWVETTVATSSQPTIVFFPGHSGAWQDVLLAGRRRADDLALATGARVLSVGCRLSQHGVCNPIEDGVAAYVWLLGEGCDLDTTAFAADSARPARAVAVLRTASHRGFPLPAEGVRSFESLAVATQR